MPEYVEINGAGAIRELIEEKFIEEDVLLALIHEETVVCQFMTHLDDVEVESRSEDLTAEETDGLTQEEWDKRTQSITLQGEAVELVDGWADTEVTLEIEDAFGLSGHHAPGELQIWNGGEWFLVIWILKEPIRHRVQDLIERAGLFRRGIPGE